MNVEIGVGAMQFTTPELRLLNTLSKNWNAIVSIERRSDREFDLIIHGTDSRTQNNFSGLMLLLGINELVDWTRPSVARMSSHPEMAKEGDWSGIRDSDEDAQWAIFYEHVVPII